MITTAYLVITCLLEWWMPSLRAAEARAMETYQITVQIKQMGIKAFTWDEHGQLWFLVEKENQFEIWNKGDNGSLPFKSFEKNGKVAGSLLIHGGIALVADGSRIRQFATTKTEELIEDKPLYPPTNLVQVSAIRSMEWLPQGGIGFYWESGESGEQGLGKFDPRTGEWDFIARGLKMDQYALDSMGRIIGIDQASGLLFRVAPGIDYRNGLEGYSKSDLALKGFAAEEMWGGIEVNKGNHLSEQPNETVLLFDKNRSTLLEFEEANGRFSKRRILTTITNGEISDLQSGPDGMIWMNDGGKQLLALGLKNSSDDQSVDLGRLPTSKLPDLLKHKNTWHRETALRVLEGRPDLPNSRGLHPISTLHTTFRNSTNEMDRVHALWALHRMRLLDDGELEETPKDKHPIVRFWAALLTAERKIPTGAAFSRLEKLAQDTNWVVRAAVIASLRPFVSDSTSYDTLPSNIPIREVFTGGIMSTLWFSAEQFRDAEFDLLYWNALRPIIDFDAAHALGFFETVDDNFNSLVRWATLRISRQSGMSPNPFHLEDTLTMLQKFKSPRLVGVALDGILTGTALGKTPPTERSKEILRKFSLADSDEISHRANNILMFWNCVPNQ
ncbi:MAG: HEAT repeat domain-containing protein [Verrucomicrobiota bacterium]|nr:HEAT repeat domain-containing protein [Verrucomicrobiota bacterium]